MSSSWPKPGISAVPEYRISSIPYLTSSLEVPASTGSPIVVEFPHVTRFLMITNTVPASEPSAPLRFAFSENGVLGVEQNNFIVLDNKESFEAEMRVSRLYLVGDTTLASSASVVAGLTMIESGQLLHNWSGSIGIG
jgi:hypothetical protein